MNVVKLKTLPKRMFCSACNAEGTAGCDCGVPYVPAGVAAAKAIEENPGMSDRAIADKYGIADRTVNRARSGATFVAPDKREGRDGKMYPATQPEKEESPTRLPFGGDILKLAKRRYAEFIGGYQKEMKAAQRREYSEWIIEREMTPKIWAKLLARRTEGKSK